MTGADLAGSARELTPQEQEDRAQLAYELDEAVKDGLRKGREALWEVAKALHQFDEESAWTALGYESLSEWLADPEVGMSRATYFRTIQAFRELCVRRRLPMATVADLEVSKVQIVLPKVKTGAVKLADAIADVRALGQRDLRDKYLSRPDPADEQEPKDGLIDETGPAAQDEEDYQAPPVNPGDDTPQWASEAGDVIEGDVVDEDEPEPVEVGVDLRADPGATAEPAQNDHPVDSGRLQSLDALVAKARAALDMPTRSGPQRRLDLNAVKAVRTSLEELVDALEELWS